MRFARRPTAARTPLAEIDALAARADALARRYKDVLRLAEEDTIPLAHHGPTRQLHGAAAIIGTSVLLDSAVEHYRGSFKNSAMWLPLISSTLTIASSLHGMAQDETDSHKARTLVYTAALGIGALGTGFHLYNVTKRVGGIRWENLFYGAPLGAPAALTLAGMAGLTADRLAGNAKRRGVPTLLGLPAGRIVAALTSLGLLGTVGEAGLLHFRGNFQNPFMFLPVTVPPVASALLAKAALEPPASSGAPRKRHRLARAWLRLTSLMGFGGALFHIYGVSRAMGGWKNWRQNMVDGPPIPAPPSFSGLAVAGLAALRLIEKADKR